MAHQCLCKAIGISLLDFAGYTTAMVDEPWVTDFIIVPEGYRKTMQLKREVTRKELLAELEADLAEVLDASEASIVLERHTEGAFDLRFVRSFRDTNFATESNNLQFRVYDPFHCCIMIGKD